MKSHSLLANHGFTILLMIVLLPPIVFQDANPAMAAEGEFTTTDSMTTSRINHTATLLPDGRVLVAGGRADMATTEIAAVELYAPDSASWITTDSLGTARVSHTATLLNNNKVLITGGLNNSGGLASAELYDSDLGAWTVTGSMNSVRSNHTATLLPNGKVLVVGGHAGFHLIGNSLSSAELYDPNLGIWTSTGSMNVARVNHTATLLPNGKVLVIGGWLDYQTPGYEYYEQSLNSAELYDPETGEWELVSPMNTDRVHHTATLLPNGKILVAGGRTITSYLHSGVKWFNFTTVGTAELYNPELNMWETTNSMNSVRRGNHTATLLPGGNVLVIGGWDYVDIFGVSTYAKSLNTAEIFNPSTGTWVIISNINQSRTDHTASLLPNGMVMVAGGYYEYFPDTAPYALTSAELLVSPIPIANAGSDQSVNTLSDVTLDGSTSSDTPLTYEWTQTGGPTVQLNNPTTVNPSFTTPNDPTELTFSLVVTDSSEFSSDVDVVSITVNNQAPISNAGPNQSVYTLTTVTLDGSGSNDPDGDLPLTYTWVQTDGPPVSLINPNGLTPSFISPNAQDVLTFSLVVTDSIEGQSFADEVVIMVNPYKIFLPLMTR